MREMAAVGKVKAHNTLVGSEERGVGVEVGGGAGEGWVVNC